MTERIPRIRQAAIPEDAVVVVRGQPADPKEARDSAEDFRRRFADWGRWGLSAFYARGESEIDDIALARLRRFGLLRVYRRAVLEEHGFEVVPTFRSPHVTIAWVGALDEGLRELDRAEHDDRTNPYHD